MRDLKLVAIDEPFTHLLTQGMVLNEAFLRSHEQGGKEYFWADDLTIVRDEHAAVVSAIAKADGRPVEYEGWTTMSKSKHNGVDPQDLIARYGADTARLFVMFASPPEQTLEWSDTGVDGAHRFLKRVWAFGSRHAAAIRGAGALQAPLDSAARGLRFEVHTVLRQVSYDYERMQYNTVVSGAMKLLNALEGFKGSNPPVLREAYGILLRVLYPACPHLTHGLWQDLGFAAALGDLLDAPWPQVEEAALLQDEVELMLQVNGKLRGSITVPALASRADIEAAALANADVERFAEGKAVKRVIVVPGRLVNVVI